MANILIESTPIWNNGEIITANNLEAYSIYDNLVNESKFCYRVQKDLISLFDGNISIKDFDYDIWMANNFSTEYALTYICQQLNLTPIIPTKKKK